MKKFILSAIAATLIAGPVATTAATAQVRERTVTTVKEGPRGQTTVTRETTTRNWARGQRFDRRYATNYRVVGDYRAYRLSAPPRGYHWVRSGRDAVLVADRGGVVRTVVTRTFR